MSAAAQADRHVWIGIGKMGLPMAGRIAAAGYQMVGAALVDKKSTWRHACCVDVDLGIR